MINKQQIELLSANLTKLGVRKLGLLGLVGVLVMASVVMAARFLGRPTMQPIYSGLTSQDISRMAEALAEAGVPFDINEQRNAVLVAFGQTAKARMLLAQKGLPTSARAGYELFDQLGSMGLTSFMQEVTRVRALEGEIARTIQALDGVAAARVHLVLPDPTSLRRDRREPSASVLLRLDARWQSQAGQAVRHIVAAAVPGMKTEFVSVASTDGRIIAAVGDDRNVGSLKLTEMERSMAAELEQRAGRTLASALGVGNFQISITVRLDVDRQQTNETTFDPKSRIERSVRTVKQSGSTEDAGAKPAVGVEANIPREEPGQTEAEKRRQREDRREELVNYEMNTKTVQTVREGYRVLRVAIAAVVSQKQLAAQLGGNPDAAAINARLADLKKLIAAATGANLDRDDTIELSAADLGSTSSILAPATTTGALDYVLMNLGTLTNAASLLIVVLLLVLLGIRPIIRILGATENMPATAKLQANDAATSEGQTKSGRSDLQVSSDAINRSMDAPRLPAKSAEDAVHARLEALVGADDVKVAKALKSWMLEARQT